MKNCVQIHPLNAKGRYYVDQNACLVCEDCRRAAPRHFSRDLARGAYGYYVAQQPGTADEEARCREAMLHCPAGAIRDDGESRETNARV